MVAYARAVRLCRVKRDFGSRTHAEQSRSAAANAYVFKDDTAVDGTRFELGAQPFRRAESTDWERVRELAKSGKFDDIPADVAVRYYGQLRRMHADALVPNAIERVVYVYWGTTGTGKSRTAWENAGLAAYPKDPRTKFWDGYRGQEHVVIDEFRGGIDISHILRWCDRYPVIVEVKGASTVLSATHIWITSNLDPREWYAGLDGETREALMRRLRITHFDAPFGL